MAKRAAADKFELYEAAVQEPEAEGDFFDRVFRSYNKRLPISIREDFCGTSNICRHWVSRRPSTRAVGLDLDGPTLAWAKKKIAALPREQAARITLHKANVLTPPPDAAKGFDIVFAFNFSYFIFKQRATLVEYFAKARRSLAPGGLFIVDFFGGSDTQVELVERKRKKGFTYIWEQAEYNPATGDLRCHISFRLKSGKTLRRVFTYDWRLYSMPELCDIFRDAGFTTVQTYLEETDKRGESTNRYIASTKGEADRCFLGYIVGRG